MLKYVILHLSCYKNTGYGAYFYSGEVSTSNLEYLPIKDIDFTPAQGKKRKLDEAIHQDSNDEATEQQATARGNESTESEMNTLFVNLSDLVIDFTILR